MSTSIFGAMSDCESDDESNKMTIEDGVKSLKIGREPFVVSDDECDDATYRSALRARNREAGAWKISDAKRRLNAIRYHETSVVQKFSIPSAIMDYIIKTPSTSNVYLKLVASCKEIFQKNPIIVVKNFYVDDYRMIANGFNVEDLLVKVWMEFLHVEYTKNDTIVCTTKKIYHTGFNKVMLEDMNEASVENPITSSITLEVFNDVVRGAEDIYLRNVHVTDGGGQKISVVQLKELEYPIREDPFRPGHFDV